MISFASSSCMLQFRIKHRVMLLASLKSPGTLISPRVRLVSTENNSSHGPALTLEMTSFVPSQFCRDIFVSELMQHRGHIVLKCKVAAESTAASIHLAASCCCESSLIFLSDFTCLGNIQVQALPENLLPCYWNFMIFISFAILLLSPWLHQSWDCSYKCVRAEE